MALLERVESSGGEGQFESHEFVKQLRAAYKSLQRARADEGRRRGGQAAKQTRGAHQRPPRGLLGLVRRGPLARPAGRTSWSPSAGV